MKFYFFQIALIIFYSESAFSQKLLWQSIEKNNDYKFVYCFTLDTEKDTANTENEELFDYTIYQINAKKELNSVKIEEIMKCVKNSRDENGRINSSECSEKKQFYVSIQI